MASNFNFIDNSAQVIREVDRKSEIGLSAIGMKAQKYAVLDASVDTGRMRNGITYKTHNDQGKTNTNPGAKAKPEDYEPHATPEKFTVYIGTNVEYAPQQEAKHHFLKKIVFVLGYT